MHNTGTVGGVDLARLVETLQYSITILAVAKSLAEYKSTDGEVVQGEAELSLVSQVYMRT
jgi:uncharacterized protein YuzB (UPF0349 family)